MISNEETDEATNQVIELLEEWGLQSKFMWFRELHRITDIDKGLLRNILNELKKTKEVKEMHGTNNRIFFCLRKYYIKCRDIEFRFKGKEIMLRDGSKTKSYKDLQILQKEQEKDYSNKKLNEKQNSHQKRNITQFTKSLNIQRYSKKLTNFIFDI